MPSRPKAQPLLSKEYVNCSQCGLGRGCRTWKIDGVGENKIGLALVGEAPGAEEDAAGKPFVGDAGRLLTTLLARAGVRREDVFVTNTVRCVSGMTTIRLPNGKTMRIDQMVKRHYAGDVLSVDVRGRLVCRKVVGWHRSPLGGRRVLRIGYQHIKGNPRGRVGVTLTDDHEVLTLRGWVRAKDLTSSDVVATGEPAPGPNTTQMVLGTVMGDAYIGQSFLQLGHSVKQAEWFDLKAKMLSPFGGKRRRIQTPKSNNFSYYTASSVYWRWLRSKFYRNHTKVVARDLVLQMKDMALAVWFLDDGYTRIRTGRRALAEIATCGFSHTEVGWLSDQMRLRGLECRVHDNGGPRLFFTADGTEALCRRIVRYVPPAMRHKIPPHLRAVEFVASAYSAEPPMVFWDAVRINSSRLPRVKFRGKTYPTKTVYCIDVEETASFVTTGGVVHNCRPIQDGRNRTPTPKEIELCSPFLEDELKRVAPKVCVALGNSAIHAMLGKDGVERLRGRDFLSDRFSCRVVPTYHPAAALYAGRRGGGADIQKAIVKDIRRAVSLCSEESKTKETLDYRLADDVRTVEEVAEALETNVGRVSFDWEGTSTHPLRNKPLGIAFSWKPGTGIYVPVAAKTALGLVPYWRENQKRVEDLLRRCLTSPARKVGHFMKYDLAVAKTYLGIDVTHADFCTGMAHHLLDENAEHDLGTLASEFTQLGAYKEKVEAYAGKRRSSAYDLAQVPLEELVKYACGDADATLRLYDVFRPRLVEEGLWPLFSRITIPLIPILVRMELRGIRLDTAALKVALKEWNEKTGGIRTEIQAGSGRGLNLNNPTHVSRMLFQRLKIPFPESRQKEGSTNKEVLEAIKDHHPVVEQVLEYRRLTKLISTYGEKLIAQTIGGTIHTSFMQHGTKTGRLSSENPNAQNITKDDAVRRAFTARPGYVFALTDFSQVELRGLAYYSRDPILLEAYSKDGVDVHRGTAAFVLQKSIEEVTEKERHDFGKRMNFGMAYGITEMGVASIGHLSLDRAREILSRFWRRFAGVAAWKERILEEARGRGYIVNIFGRRRRHADLNSSVRWVRAAAEREIANAIIQGTCSADIPNYAAIRVQAMLDRAGCDGHMLLQEHDGIVWELREDEADDAIPRIVAEMERQPHQDWDIPLKVDVSKSYTWKKEETAKVTERESKPTAENIPTEH